MGVGACGGGDVGDGDGDDVLASASSQLKGWRRIELGWCGGRWQPCCVMWKGSCLVSLPHSCPPRMVLRPPSWATAGTRQCRRQRQR
jgi:hypothetical protein